MSLVACDALRLAGSITQSRFHAITPVARWAATQKEGTTMTNTETPEQAAQRTEASIMAWAQGDYALETAARITLTTTLRSQFIRMDGTPTLWLWMPSDPQMGGYATPRWADLLVAADDIEQPAYLSGSAKFLCQLAQNIAHGPTRSGPLDLSRGLWQLDRTNSAAVLAALTVGMTR